MPQTQKKTAQRPKNTKATNRSGARPKVSIVVPIYNVEKYLHECVDSILAQTLKEIEVILIDDGSPDRCGEIVDEYAAKDPRVVAVHQENSGYSKGVNRGIEMAKGEYIGIIESDDWIEPDMYEKLYASAKKYDTDITKGGFYFYQPHLREEDQNVVYRNPRHVDLAYAPEGAFHITEWPRLIAFHASIWSSIYRAEFVKQIKIPETAGASYQDFPFMAELLTKAERISVVKEPFVHWRNEPGQDNSTAAKGAKLLFMVKNSETGLQIVKDSGYFEKLREPLLAHIFWANLSFYERIGRRYKREYYERLHRIFSPLKSDPNFHYLYFRDIDHFYARDFIEPRGWYHYQWRRLWRGLGRRLANLSPTYRQVCFLRDKWVELEDDGYFDLSQKDSETGMIGSQKTNGRHE